MFDSSCWLLICMTYMFSCVACFGETSLGKISLVDKCEVTSRLQGFASSC